MPIRAEVFAIEHLEAYASAWAQQERTLPQGERGLRLLPRLADNERVLVAAQKRFSETARQGSPLSSSAEWLLDNFYVVQEQLRLVQQDLSRGYYHELPKVANRHGAGYPRVYGIALELIAHTDSRLDADVVSHFVQGYQAVSPLTLGELWAIAIMLRVGLVENLRRLVAQSLLTMDKHESAEVWAKLLRAEPLQARDTISGLPHTDGVPGNGVVPPAGARPSPSARQSRAGGARAEGIVARAALR